MNKKQIQRLKFYIILQITISIFDQNEKNFFFDIYTGNLGRGQNFDNILKVFASKQVSNLNIRLIIFGSGKNFDEMKKEIKKINLKILFFRKQSRQKDLKDYVLCRLFYFKIEQWYWLIQNNIW